MYNLTIQKDKYGLIKIIPTLCKQIYTKAYIKYKSLIQIFSKPLRDQ